MVHFWQCLATFRIDHSEEKADIIYTILKRSIFDMFWQCPATFRIVFFRGKQLKSSMSPLKKYIFDLFWPCPTLFEIRLFWIISILSKFCYFCLPDHVISMELLARSSLTYIPGFSVNFSFSRYIPIMQIRHILIKDHI